MSDNPHTDTELRDGVLVFSPDSLEARAFTVLHAYGDGRTYLPGVSSRLGRAGGGRAGRDRGFGARRPRRRAEHRFRGVRLRRARLRLGRSHCFRARFEPLEETLRTKWIAQLPALPPPLAH